MSSKISVTKDQTSVSPIVAVEGEEPIYAIRVPNVKSSITSDATLVMGFFKKNTNTDLSATYLSGSMSISGTDIIVTKKLQSLKAGEWVFDVRGTVDGILREIIRVPLIVKRRGEL